MQLNPDEIFSDLIAFRKEIHAPVVQMNYTVKPFRFLLYNPANINGHFHFMPCHHVRNSITNLRRTSSTSGVFPMIGALPQKLSVCRPCLNAWNNRYPAKHLDADAFDIVKLFALWEYDPHLWDGIAIPPEINADLPGCFLLYRPTRVTHNAFHFMKCKTVREDEQTGWIRTYRFTNETSGAFEMFGGGTQRLRPCSECLAEWDNGRGWNGYGDASDEERKAIRGSFSIAEFFEHCRGSRELVELYSLMENNAVWFSARVSNDYPDNWEAITDMYRAARRYRCEQCGVDMSKYPELAITHHVNASHPEISPENMRVLCIWCHSKQPHHARTVNFNRYQYNLLRKLRKEQGIKIDDLQ